MARKSLEEKEAEGQAAIARAKAEREAHIATFRRHLAAGNISESHGGSRYTYSHPGTNYKLTALKFPSDREEEGQARMGLFINEVEGIDKERVRDDKAAARDAKVKASGKKPKPDTLTRKGVDASQKAIATAKREEESLVTQAEHEASFTRGLSSGERVIYNDARRWASRTKHPHESHNMAVAAVNKHRADQNIPGSAITSDYQMPNKRPGQSTPINLSLEEQDAARRRSRAIDEGQDLRKLPYEYHETRIAAVPAVKYDEATEKRRDYTYPHHPYDPDLSTEENINNAHDEYKFGKPIPSGVLQGIQRHAAEREEWGVSQEDVVREAAHSVASHKLIAGQSPRTQSREPIPSQAGIVEERPHRSVGTDYPHTMEQISHSSSEAGKSYHLLDNGTDRMAYARAYNETKAINQVSDSEAHDTALTAVNHARQRQGFPAVASREQRRTGRKPDSPEVIAGKYKAAHAAHSKVQAEYHATFGPISAREEELNRQAKAGEVPTGVSPIAHRYKDPELLKLQANRDEVGTRLQRANAALSKARSRHVAAGGNESIEESKEPTFSHGSGTLHYPGSTARTREEKDNEANGVDIESTRRKALEYKNNGPGSPNPSPRYQETTPMATIDPKVASTERRASRGKRPKVGGPQAAKAAPAKLPENLPTATPAPSGFSDTTIDSLLAGAKKPTRSRKAKTVAAQEPQQETPRVTPPEERTGATPPPSSSGVRSHYGPKDYTGPMAKAAESMRAGDSSEKRQGKIQAEYNPGAPPKHPSEGEMAKPGFSRKPSGHPSVDFYAKRDSAKPAAVTSGIGSSDSIKAAIKQGPAKATPKPAGIGSAEDIKRSIRGGSAPRSDINPRITQSTTPVKSFEQHESEAMALGNSGRSKPAPAPSRTVSPQHMGYLPTRESHSVVSHGGTVYAVPSSASIRSDYKNTQEMHRHLAGQGARTMSKDDWESSHGPDSITNSPHAPTPRAVKDERATRIVAGEHMEKSPRLPPRTSEGWSGSGSYVPVAPTGRVSNRPATESAPSVSEEHLSNLKPAGVKYLSESRTQRAGRKLRGRANDILQEHYGSSDNYSSSSPGSRPSTVGTLAGKVKDYLSSRKPPTPPTGNYGGPAGESFSSRNLQGKQFGGE